MTMITKKSRMGEIRLERKMLTRYDSLILKRDRCNSCGLCIEVCVRDAITMKPAVFKEGKILRLPVLDIDNKKCILCGMCAVICPLNALEAWVNSEKTAMFVDNEAFPDILKNISVDVAHCKPECGLVCEENCPKEAITVATLKEDNHIKKVNEVYVDKNLCIYCKACEYVCPYGSIVVKRPFEGLVTVERAKCPEDCRICIDICPSNSIKVTKDKELEINSNICVFCKACQKICPEAAIHVKIKRVLHTPIKSSTWINLLQRFASNEAAAKEMASKSIEKRRSRIRTRFH